MAVMEDAFDPAYGEAWNLRQITDALAMPSTRGLVVGASGKVIPDESLNNIADPAAGFVLTRQAADEEELLLIAVTSEFRRRGLGESLIHTLFDAAKARGTTRIFLEMRRGNPAIHLYEKVGFKPIGKRTNYYRLANGERVDAITFGCSI
jgi:[ribosomal protein S18]-alanine N-acetyltransferase